MGRSRAAVFVAAAFALAACSNQSLTPSASRYDLGGQYAGTGQDSVLGNATASTTLAESNSVLTGIITLASTTSSATLSQAVTLSVNASYRVSGTSTASVGTGSCSFSLTGGYDTGTYVLTGSYAATNGCSGESGSFTMTQECIAPETGERFRQSRPGSC
jgi:hypothetical protein